VKVQDLSMWDSHADLQFCLHEAAWFGRHSGKAGRATACCKDLRRSVQGLGELSHRDGR